ncbi:MAG: c-type cytochrome [Verrucomicrobiae bacterium]|nr:c-type cytochrome [Verrucomicrobiae bacterium]
MMAPRLLSAFPPIFSPSRFPATGWLAGFAGLVLSLPAGAADDYQPHNTQKPGEEPPTPEETVAAITLPEGFQARLFAGEPDVRQPIAMAVDDRGRLWVAESYSYYEWEHKGEDRILVFEDTDNDGRHDTRKVFWTGGNHVSGMTVGWGGVWVCDSPNLLFIPDRDRDDVPDGEPEIVLDGWTTEAKHNFFNGLTWGIDGWLYGRHGITTASSVGAPGTPEEERVKFDCSIWRYHPVTKAFEIVCRGTTNPWGLDWNEAGELFFTNNVNGHLWHGIFGAFYPRMGNRDDRFIEHVYDRIGMCADHLHHAGSTDDWTKTRDGKGVHGELGGGHSHCGGMIYLGGKWPETYHGRMLMCNTHGRRVNMDELERHGSGYVATHGPDFLKVGSDWFRGVQLLYGPDGDVYLSDWTDHGECHDSDGVHRGSGRIYKIIYGDPSPKPETNLFDAPQETLVDYQLHGNEWYARMSRHILQMRAAEGKIERPEEFKEVFRKVLAVHPEDQVRLRLLLTLHVTNTLPHEALNDLVHDDSETIRTWAVRLCTEHQYAEDPNVQIAFNPNDRSLQVRLAWASLLQKATFEGIGWRVARQLVGDPAIADDQNLPQMIWYGIKDHVTQDPEQAVRLIAETKVPSLQTNIARRLASDGQLEPVLALLPDLPDAAAKARLLEGIQKGIAGRTDLQAPPSWETALAAATADPDLRPVAERIDFVLNRNNALDRQRTILSNEESTDAELSLAIDLVTEARDAKSADAVLGLLGQPNRANLHQQAVASLAAYPKPEIGRKLVDVFPGLRPESQAAAVNTLVSNPGFASALLDALEGGAIPRHVVTAYHARQIQSFKGAEHDTLKRRLAKAWGSTKSSSSEKQALIKQFQDQLLPDILAKADVANGHLKFQQLCMACHTLHGEGGQVGPDLTGANRAEVFYLLENIIDPSATLPQDFQLTLITRKDGSVVSGNVKSENEYAVTVRTLTDEQMINVGDIAKRETLPQSIMPEGLLTTLQPDEVRDLIAFLQK